MPSVVQRRSYGSVTIFSFDRDLALAQLRAAATRLMSSRADLESVILFGSVARGDAVPGSDADIAIILAPTSPLAAQRPMDRALAFAEAFRDAGLGVDIVALTRAELSAGSLATTVSGEGIVLAP